MAASRKRRGPAFVSLSITTRRQKARFSMSAGGAAGRRRGRPPFLRLHWLRGIELPPRRGCLSSGTRPGPSRPPCPGFMGEPAVDQFITSGKPRPRLVLHASSLGLASGARGPATPLGE